MKYTTQQPSYCELTTSADKGEKVHWASITLVNVYVDLLVFTRIAGTS